MKHTLFFHEGTWEARGLYTDAAGEVMPLQGKSEITHVDGIWVNESYMDVEDQESRISNRYEITPFAEGRDYTSWKSVNPAIGDLSGMFMLVGDSILSTFSSENGEYFGFEYLQKVDDTTYRNRGFAFFNNQKLSSWEVELKRAE